MTPRVPGANPLPNFLNDSHPSIRGSRSYNWIPKGVWMKTAARIQFARAPRCQARAGPVWLTGGAPPERRTMASANR